MKRRPDVAHQSNRGVGDWVARSDENLRRTATQVPTPDAFEFECRSAAGKFGGYAAFGQELLDQCALVALDFDCAALDCATAATARFQVFSQLLQI